MVDANPERLTAAEYRCLIDYLGLSPGDVATLLGVGERSARSWWQGRSPVAHETKAFLLDLADRADAEVSSLLDQIDEDDMEGRAPGPWVTWKVSERMWEARPDLRPLPARWHRQCVARAWREYRDVRVRFGDGE